MIRHRKIKMKQKILELRQKKLSYRTIKSILGCSLSTVAFHCGKGQKEKNANRTRKNRLKQHPFKSKMDRFIYRKQKQRKYDGNCKSNLKKQLRDKLYDFKSQGINMNQNYTIEDIVTKFGENPVCYLTGEPIDINKPSTYEFDHIIPVSRGGDNSLDNLQIATRKANQSKRNMTPDELIFFCKKILEHHNYQITSGSKKI